MPGAATPPTDSARHAPPRMRRPGSTSTWRLPRRRSRAATKRPRARARDRTILASLYPLISGLINEVGEPLQLLVRELRRGVAQVGGDGLLERAVKKRL